MRKILGNAMKAGDIFLTFTEHVKQLQLHIANRTIANHGGIKDEGRSSSFDAIHLKRTTRF